MSGGGVFLVEREGGRGSVGRQGTVQPGIVYLCLHACIDLTCAYECTLETVAHYRVWTVEMASNQVCVDFG